MPRISVKEKIVAAAIETLHRKGFNGTSVQDITDAAGVPKGSFYNHFDSKEDLAVETLNRYWEQVDKSLGILTDGDEPPLAQLRSYFRHLNDIARLNEYKTGCLVGNMSSEMSEQSNLIRDRLGVMLAAWTAAIEASVRRGQGDGSVRKDVDPPLIAAFLLHAWEGAVMRSKVDRNHTPLTNFEVVAFACLRP